MREKALSVATARRGEHLRDVLIKDPASLAFVGLADLCLREGETEEAIRLCEEGLGYHPNHSTGHLVLGLALAKAGQETKSIRALQEVVNLDPGNRLAIQHLGEAYRRTGKRPVREQRPPHAAPPKQEEEERAVDLGEEIAFFTFSMAEVYEKQGFFEKALAIYQRVLTLQPHRDDVRERIRKLKSTMSAA